MFQGSGEFSYHSNRCACLLPSHSVHTCVCVCVSSFQGSHHVAIVESLRKLFCNVKFSVLFFLLLLSSNFPLMKKKETSKYRTPTFKSVPSFPRQFRLRLQTRLIILARYRRLHCCPLIVPTPSILFSCCRCSLFFSDFHFSKQFLLPLKCYSSIYLSS